MAQHVIVFIDHHKATVLRLDGSQPDTLTTDSQHLIGKNPHGSGAYFSEIVHAVRDDREILIVGPGTAKTEFMSYLEGHDQHVHARVVGIETVDHPTNNQLIALARAAFKAIDQTI